MDGERRDLRPRPAARGTRAISGDGSARRRQAVGLSLKIWSAVAPISAARSAALTMPSAEARWAPRRRPSGSIARHRSGRHSATVAVTIRDPTRTPGLRTAQRRAREGRAGVPPRRPARVDPGQAEQARPAAAGDPRPLLPRGPRLRGEGGQHAPGPPPLRTWPRCAATSSTAADDARGRDLPAGSADGRVERRAD